MSSPQAKIYAKDAAVFIDFPAASIRDRYLGRLVYIPGKTYALTHRNNAITPKLFTVLEYHLPEDMSEVEVDLVIRSFDPYTHIPRSLSRVRFPRCLDGSLSPENWQIKTVHAPEQAASLNDVVIPLPGAIEPLSHQSSQVDPLRPPAGAVSVLTQPIVPTRDRRSSLTQKNSPPGKGLEIVELKKAQAKHNSASTPSAPKPSPVGAKQQFEFIKSDKDRVREILKRWVQLSEATSDSWQIEFNDVGFVVRDRSNRLIFEYQATEESCRIGSSLSGLVLQEKMTQIALKAPNKLSPMHDRQLIEYANEVLVRVQDAPTDTMASFMQSVFKLKPAHKTKKRSS